MLLIENEIIRCTILSTERKRERGKKKYAITSITRPSPKFPNCNIVESKPAPIIIGDTRTQPPPPNFNWRKVHTYPTVIIQGLARRRLYHTGLHRTRKKGTPPPPPPPRSPTDTIPTLAQFNRLSNTGGRKGGKRERGRGATEPRDDDRSIVFSPRLHAAPEREGGGEKVADIYHSRDTSQLEPGVILY